MRIPILLVSGFCALSALLDSCTPAVKATTSRTREINGSILQVPVLVDLEVSPSKVTGTASFTNQPVDYVKGMAVADALKNSNSDVLVEPSYDVETSNMTIKVTVKGYPATYKNFRTATKGDTTLVKYSIRAGYVAPPAAPAPTNPLMHK
jgi:hypothetical protein